MAISTDPQSTPNISNPDSNPTQDPASASSPSAASSPDEKYARLEDLLRQTLALAAEVSESNKTPLRPTSPYTHAQLPGTCIVLRRALTTVSGPAGGSGVRRHSSAGDPYRRHPRRETDIPTTPPSGSSSSSSSSNDEQCIPDVWAAGSVQEPFSPRCLARSLDAVVKADWSFRKDLSGLNSASSTAERTSAVGRPSTPGRLTESAMASPLRARSQGPASAPAARQARAAPSRPPLRPPLRPWRSSFGAGRGAAGERPTMSSSPPPPLPPRWHVRILPVAFTPGEAAPPPPNTPASPASIKLEAVFPNRFFTDGTAAATGWSSEGSYVIIGRLPAAAGEVVGIGESPPLHCGGYEHRFQTAHGKTLREFIDDWEYAAGTPAEG